MSKFKQSIERFYPESRVAWRAWLQANHNDSPGIWLIYYKKQTGKPTVTYAEAVEEALCFGWIDSVPNKLDEERHMQVFTPRKPKSPWSKVNKQRIKNLIEQDLMMPAGLEKIEAAKKDGSWTLLDAIEELVVADDLAKALADNPTANDNFQAFNASSKKGILWWIESAKRPETRQKRIEQTVAMAAQNKRAQFDKM